MEEKKAEFQNPDSEDNLGKNYWNERWEKAETGWDIGNSSPPIEKYMLRFENKNAAILIPGCGNAYEAEFLIENGFTNITILDISKHATNLLKSKFENHNGIKIFCEDFFEHSGKYDLIIEQTFFCAIPITMRNDYAKKTAELLNKNGQIIGLLFNKIFEKQGPPFGGTEAEYKKTFENYFEIEKMENCYNSISARNGNEFFIIFKKNE